jgi:hypothetical protein
MFGKLNNYSIVAVMHIIEFVLGEGLLCSIFKNSLRLNKRELKQCNFALNMAPVCVRGGPNQPLHRDPQWSIVMAPVRVQVVKNSILDVSVAFFIS